MGTLGEDMARLRAEIDSERASRQAAAADRRAAVADLAAQVRAELEQSHHDRLAKADALRGKLQETIQEIVVGVDEIKRDARAQVASHGQTRAASAVADAHARANALAAVRDEVAGICDESARARAQVRFELAQGRAAWRSGSAAAAATPSAIAPAVNKRPASAVTNGASAQAAPKKPTSVRVDPNRVDDLEEIVGIGPSTKRVLAEAGLKSFGSIAASSPEKLNEVLGDLARFANVEHWIRQAREMLD